MTATAQSPPASPAEPQINVVLQRQLSAAEKAEVQAAFIDDPTAVFAIHWLELCVPDGGTAAKLQPLYLLVRDRGSLCALALAYRVVGLDTAQYMGPGLGRASLQLARVGLRPFAYDIVYVSLPLSMGRSVFFVTGTSPGQRAAIARALLACLRRQVGYDMLCLLSDEHGVTEAALSGCGLYRVPFLDDTSLPLPYTSWDAYLQPLPRKLRTRIRGDRRRFADRGGTVERIRDPAAHADILAELYRRTSSRGRLQLPVAVTPEFFVRLAQSPSDAVTLFGYRVGEKLAGFSLLVHYGRWAEFPICGLDYELSAESRTYFNIYYQLIEEALGRGLERLGLGSTVYDFKCRIGAQRVQTAYHIEFRHPLLRAFAPAMAWFLGQQFRAAGAAAGHGS